MPEGPREFDAMERRSGEDRRSNWQDALDRLRLRQLTLVAALDRLIDDLDATRLDPREIIRRLEELLARYRA